MAFPSSGQCSGCRLHRAEFRWRRDQFQAHFGPKVWRERERVRRKADHQPASCRIDAFGSELERFDSVYLAADLHARGELIRQSAVIAVVDEPARRCRVGDGDDENLRRGQANRMSGTSPKRERGERRRRSRPYLWPLAGMPPALSSLRLKPVAEDQRQVAHRNKLRASADQLAFGREKGGKEGNSARVLRTARDLDVELDS